MYLSAGFHGHGQVSPAPPPCTGTTILIQPAVPDLRRRPGPRGNAQDRPMGSVSPGVVQGDHGAAGEESTRCDGA